MKLHRFLPGILGLVMIVGLATPAFADTVVATFYDPSDPIGTPNPLANGDPKTNDWLDVANPGAVTNPFSNNVDATAGNFIPDQTVDIYRQSGTIGSAVSCPPAGTLCVTYNVDRGFEEGSFTFSGLPANVPVQVSVIISDMDYTGVTQDSAGNIPAEEDVLVTGNGVDLGSVTPNGVIGQNQVLSKTFVTLAQSDAFGDLTIGFNQVFRDAISTPSGIPLSIFNSQFGIRVEQISLDFNDSIDREVGGEILSIDSTALILAGIQSSAIWMLPILAGAVGAGFAAFKIRKRI